MASSLDLATDALAVEVVSVGTLETGVIAPDFAAEVVVELGEESSVLEFFGGESDFLRGEGC